jgi:hypothetical protein
VSHPRRFYRGVTSASTIEPEHLHFAVEKDRDSCRAAEPDATHPKGNMELFSNRSCRLDAVATQYSNDLLIGTINLPTKIGLQRGVAILSIMRHGLFNLKTPYQFMTRTCPVHPGPWEHFRAFGGYIFRLQISFVILAAQVIGLVMLTGKGSKISFVYTDHETIFLQRPRGLHSADWSNLHCEARQGMAVDLSVSIHAGTT